MGSLLTGVAEGGFFCVVPLLTGRMWGSKHYGANLGMFVLGPALGSVLLSDTLGRWCSRLESVASGAPCSAL